MLAESEMESEGFRQLIRVRSMTWITSVIYTEIALAMGLCIISDAEAANPVKAQHPAAAPHLAEGKSSVTAASPVKATGPATADHSAKESYLPVKSAGGTGDWYSILKLAEQQLAQGNFTEGTGSYIKSLTAAESAQVKCGEARLIELIAVGDEVVVRGSKPVKPDSLPSVAENNKLVETALSAREHIANIVCGANSAAVVAAWQGMLLHYNMMQNKALALALQKKLIAAPALGRFDEVEIYHRACAARSSAVMNKEISRVMKQHSAAH